LEAQELAFVQRAARELERPRFLISAAAKLGQPIEALTRTLPEATRNKIITVSHKALHGALGLAIKTVDAGAGSAISGGVTAAEEIAVARARMHTTASAISGGAGGFFGGWAIGAELPVSTSIILRSIAETAAIFGEDLSSPEVKLECISVFSLGGESPRDDAAESAYYAARVALAGLIADVARSMAGKSAADLAGMLGAQASPIVIRLIAMVAQRFNIVVSQKLIAQALPVVGAIGGASMNVLFAGHFARVATMHFGLRMLERKYGAAAVRAEYDRARHTIDV